ncbi:MAG TPA: dihydroorotase [Oribacterium sp.]|nr:dihydroorotase [Oribacterium sp.]
MSTLLKNAAIFTREGFIRQDIILSDARVLFDFPKNEKVNKEAIDTVYDLNGLFIIPGFADVHVHLREPGFSYKENIRTGTLAAAHGGYTAVCAMPNIKPVPSNYENLKQELECIRRDAVVHVYPYGSITEQQTGRGALSNMDEIAEYVCAFSDDGKGMQEREQMRQAMIKAKSLHRMIVAHCEDETELKPGGCIHDGEYARLHHHVGINSASEWKQVARDVALAEETGERYHVCHVSTKESVAIIREAKKRGVPVTCETGPHYLMFTDMDLKEDGSWKMNPPIRSREDRDALIEGVIDGTIDCIVTDHAPHSQEEKAKGLDGSSFGIVGLETCFSAMYTHMVLQDPRHPGSGKGAIRLEKLIELMSVNPREAFSLPGPRYVEEGAAADLTVLDLTKRWTVDSSRFFSMGRSTLFQGMELVGEPVMTFVDGKPVYKRAE